LRAGVLDALSVPRRCYPPLLLGLTNLLTISREEVLGALRQYRDGLTDRLEHVRATWERQRPLPYFVDAMFDYSIMMIQAEVAWVEEFIRQMEHSLDVEEGNVKVGS
jgi:hypothetical protein